MRIGLILFFLFRSTISSAQYYDSLLQASYALSEQGKYQASQEVLEKVRASLPENLNVYIQSSYNLLHLGKVDEAGGYISTGLQIDPTNYSLYLNGALYFAAKGNTTSAQAYLIESLKVFPTTNFSMKDALEGIIGVGMDIQQGPAFEALARWYEQQQQLTMERYPSLDEINTTFSQLVEQNPTELISRAHAYATHFAGMNWHETVLAVYSQAALWLRSYGYLSQGLEMAQTGYTHYYKNGYRENAFQASFLLYQLIESYQTIGNYERVIQHVEELTTVATKVNLHVYDILGLVTASAAYQGLGKPEEAKYMAGLTVQFAQKYGFGYALVRGYNATFINAFSQEGLDPKEVVNYGELAQQYAFNYHFDDLAYAMYDNLAIAYLRLNTVEGQAKCISTMGGLVKYYKSQKQFGHAAVTLNNLGALVYSRGDDFNWAAEVFEESIQLAENDIRHLSYEDKLNLYQSQVSAYQFLTACYAQLNNPAGAFESMEGSRGRVLRERLADGKKVNKSSIRELQNLLQADEAYIAYSLFSGHEVSILMVTKKSSQVIFHSDNTFIGDIMDKYRSQADKEHGERKGMAENNAYDPDRRVQQADFNKVTQLTRKFFERPGMADDVLKEYLRGYYRFLILPISNRLTGIKKLLISSDDVLNYIPYEALLTHDEKYLVEKFDVKYLHSVGVLRQLLSREYAANRKSLFAMGGAIFKRMNIEAAPLRTQKDKNQLQLEVSANAKKGASQRRAYAAVFGTDPMNYLPGTVEEVKSISKVVKDAEMLMGEQMTENRVKTMSASDQLANYKVLHMATHGFVVNDVPDLSGIAMSIFSNEQDGEDGYLSVNEMASLRMNADLAVLSACQTALGKIYSGEGVTGLTQSLLIAGANAALVSLWPVNDTSTMLFMSELYRESAKGKSYIQVVNELKRKFIKGDFGDQYKHPNYWAPFVYYGR